MLTNVPKGINKTARIVTLNHPNSMECVAFRKVLTRTEEGPEQTIGGMGMLSGEDEAEYTYERLGECRMLKMNEFVASPSFGDRDGYDYAEAEMFALIESTAAPEETTYFRPEKHDVIYFLPGAGISIAWQIVDVPTVAGIGEQNQRYGLNKRDDLDYVEAFGEMA